MEKLPMYITTSLHARPTLQQEGKAWADSLGAVFVERGERTIEQLFADYAVPAWLIYTAKGPELRTPAGRHFFHLSMAELRIQHIRQGQQDHLLEAIGAQTPIHFLDCTCGFGADTTVASFGLPQGSTIRALEVSPYMAAITAWGFASFVHKMADVTQALRRIQLRCTSYEQFLCDQGKPFYDVLYFDPMFSHPVMTSPQFQPVRDLLEPQPLTLPVIEQALSCARRRVVIKGRSFKNLTKAYPDVKLYGGKYSRIGYAVLECNHG